MFLTGKCIQDLGLSAAELEELIRLEIQPSSMQTFQSLQDDFISVEGRMVIAFEDMKEHSSAFDHLMPLTLERHATTMELDQLRSDMRELFDAAESCARQISEVRRALDHYEARLQQCSFNVEIDKSGVAQLSEMLRLMEVDVTSLEQKTESHRSNLQAYDARIQDVFAAYRESRTSVVAALPSVGSPIKKKKSIIGSYYLQVSHAFKFWHPQLRYTQQSFTY